VARYLAENSGQTKDNGSGVVRRVWVAGACTLLPAFVREKVVGERSLTIPADGLVTGFEERLVRVGADCLSQYNGIQRALAIPTGQTKDNGSGVVRPVWVTACCDWGLFICCGFIPDDLPATIDMTIEVTSGTCACLDGYTVSIPKKTVSPACFVDYSQAVGSANPCPTVTFPLWNPTILCCYDSVARTSAWQIANATNLGATGCNLNFSEATQTIDCGPPFSWVIENAKLFTGFADCTCPGARFRVTITFP
jgi:hypothetical protein